MGISLSFLPWIAFWVLSGRSFAIAAAASAVVVVFITIRDIREHNIKILDLGTLVFFVLLTVTALDRQGDTHSHLHGSY